MRRRKTHPVTIWLQEKWNFTVFPVLEDYYQGVINFTMIAVIALVVGASLWWVNQKPSIPEAATLLTVPGGHFWATERYDAQGTRIVPFDGPQDPSCFGSFPIPMVFLADRSSARMVWSYWLGMIKL